MSKFLDIIFNNESTTADDGYCTDINLSKQIGCQGGGSIELSRVITGERGLISNGSIFLHMHFTFYPSDFDI